MAQLGVTTAWFKLPNQHIKGMVVLTWIVCVGYTKSCAFDIKNRESTVHLVTIKHNRYSEFISRVEKMFISWEAGQFSHNLLCVFMYKKTKFPFRFQNFPSNTNISHKSHLVLASYYTIFWNSCLMAIGVPLLGCYGCGCPIHCSLSFQFVFLYM